MLPAPKVNAFNELRYYWSNDQYLVISLFQSNDLDASKRLLNFNNNVDLIHVKIFKVLKHHSLHLLRSWNWLVLVKILNPLIIKKKRLGFEVVFIESLLVQLFWFNDQGFI